SARRLLAPTVRTLRSMELLWLRAPRIPDASEHLLTNRPTIGTPTRPDRHGKHGIVEFYAWIEKTRHDPDQERSGPRRSQRAAGRCQSGVALLAVLRSSALRRALLGRPLGRARAADRGDHPASLRSHRARERGERGRGSDADAVPASPRRPGPRDRHEISRRRLSTLLASAGFSAHRPTTTTDGLLRIASAKPRTFGASARTRPGGYRVGRAVPAHRPAGGGRRDGAGRAHRRAHRRRPEHR